MSGRNWAARTKGWGDDLKSGLDAFFDSLSIGSGGMMSQLFTLHEIADTWYWSKAVLSDWVDANGNYRGDDSISTGETMAIGQDSTYESHFAAVGGSGGSVRQHDVGHCSVEDDKLVVPSEGELRRYRITRVGQSVDSKARFLFLGVMSNNILGNADCLRLRFRNAGDRNSFSDI